MIYASTSEVESEEVYLLVISLSGLSLNSYSHLMSGKVF